jgi:ferredoxin-type protein NapH
VKRQRVRRIILASFFLLLPLVFNYFSPYLMISGAAERVLSASVFVWGLYLLSGVVFGRAACGWFCPFSGLQMIWDRIAPKPLKRVRFLPWLKYVLWAGWAAAFVAVLVVTGGPRHADVLYSTPHLVSIDAAGNNITYFMLVGLVLLPTVTLGKRGFCHYVCPFMGWMTAGVAVRHVTRTPTLHLESDPATCTDCGRCDTECPMSLPVAKMAAAGKMHSADCILCGRCVDSCRQGAIRYAWRTPRRTPQPERTPSPVAEPPES